MRPSTLLRGLLVNADAPQGHHGEPPALGNARSESLNHPSVNLRTSGDVCRQGREEGGATNRVRQKEHQIKSDS